MPVTEPATSRTTSRVPAQAGIPANCRGCGTAAPPGRERAVGVWSIHGGATFWDCDDCARANLDAIEAGLERARW